VFENIRKIIKNLQRKKLKKEQNTTKQENSLFPKPQHKSRITHIAFPVIGRQPNTFQGWRGVGGGCGWGI